ncbi:MAG: hypothetical protein QM579_13550 [Desulfovibrio sp.]|uniref:hypothetical protein n=1 Tax=Desulfovibrio sp. TaxID=885 RepID=UPI0039E4943D
MPTDVFIAESWLSRHFFPPRRETVVRNFLTLQLDVASPAMFIVDTQGRNTIRTFLICIPGKSILPVGGNFYVTIAIIFVYQILSSRNKYIICYI